ncbi:MAG TPA: hypothetical protein VGW38_14750, partial [Chloroflexota bacterium]|nr:hypothetical protein [Chloroflexota bacterium]
MPMDSGLLVERVLNHDAKTVALPDADFGAGHLAIVSPDLHIGLAGSENGGGSGRGSETQVNCAIH